MVSGTGLGNDGAGHVPFLPLTQNQRPALLLNNGIVYVTFASYSDYDPYHGWMIAFNAASLDFIDAYNTTLRTAVAAAPGWRAPDRRATATAMFISPPATAARTRPRCSIRRTICPTVS